MKELQQQARVRIFHPSGLNQEVCHEYTHLAKGVILFLFTCGTCKVIRTHLSKGGHSFEETEIPHILVLPHPKHLKSYLDGTLILQYLRQFLAYNINFIFMWSMLMGKGSTLTVNSVILCRFIHDWIDCFSEFKPEYFYRIALKRVNVKGPPAYTHEWFLSLGVVVISVSKLKS